MSKGVIYCAHCLVNGKKYIGQTINYQNRLKRHKSDSKKVDNKFYRAIKKYGWESFIWGIIEEYDVNFLNEKETYWIEKYNSYYFGYNSNFGALTPVDPKRFKKFTIKSPNGEIFNISNQSEFCRKYNLDSRALFKLLTGKRKSHKGWTLPETIKIGPKAISDSLSREFCFKSPSGEIIKGKNISKFCRDHKLSTTEVYKLLNKKIKTYKGWTIP